MSLKGTVAGREAGLQKGGQEPEEEAGPGQYPRAQPTSDKDVTLPVGFSTMSCLLF
jgi:hypothetical protein